MNEAEWLTTADPELMLEFIRAKVSDRKLRLFGCASCRRIWPLLTNERSRRAVEAAEQYADELIPADQLERFLEDAQVPEANQGFANIRHAAVAVTCLSYVTEQPDRIVVWAADAVGWKPLPKRPGQFGDKAELDEEAAEGERAAQADVLRELCGNPFRPVTVNPSWLTSTVVALATGINQDRAFDRLPILADALQDAGCDNDDLLNHFRGDGPHVLGCWALDLVL